VLPVGVPLPILAAATVPLVMSAPLCTCEAAAKALMADQTPSPRR
jgi:hypothetical protein